MFPEFLLIAKYIKITMSNHWQNADYWSSVASGSKTLTTAVLHSFYFFYNMHLNFFKYCFYTSLHTTFNLQQGVPPLRKWGIVTLKSSARNGAGCKKFTMRLFGGYIIGGMYYI